MANTVISPNMNMPVPVVGTDPGPDWANNINASLSIVDSHTHTAGQGVPITPQAININADLSMNNYNLTNARSLRFYPQASAINASTDLGCLYENGVDLYFIDGAGNNVRITQGGAVTGATGTITGLPSGTASASFSAGTFTFQSATNTPAAMNFGPITLGQAVASGKNVTISASGSQASNYNLTLPVALPSSKSYLVSDTSGNQSFTAFSNGEVVLDTGNGHGSVATKRRRFVNATVTGSTLSYTDSSTNGGTITALVDCIVVASYTDNPTGGPTVNSTGLVGISSIPAAQRLGMFSATGFGCASAAKRLSAGDVLSALDEGANTNTDDRTMFRVTVMAIL